MQVASWRSVKTPPFSPSLFPPLPAIEVNPAHEKLVEPRGGMPPWHVQVRGIQNRIEDIKSTISSLEAELSDLVNDLNYIGRCARQNHGNVSPFSESSWSDMHSTPESSPTTASPDPVPVTPPSLFFSTLQLQSKPFSPAPRKRTPTVPEQPRLATLSRDEIAKSLASDPLLEGHTPKPTALERYKPMDMKVAEPTSCRQVLQREVLCFHCNKPCIPTPRITRSDNRNSNAGRPYVVHEQCPNQINFLYFVDTAGWQGVPCDCGFWCIPEGRQRHIDPTIPSQTAICPKRAPHSCGARFERLGNGKWLSAPSTPPLLPSALGP